MARLSVTGEIIDDEPVHWLKTALAFRPLFLLAAVFSVFALSLWWLMFAGKVSINVYGGMLWWHLHEMLFGFAVAVITGFLLTAVQTWTQLPSFQSYPLLALVLLWLAARVLMFMPSIVAPELIAVVDMLYLPVCGLFMGYVTIKAKRWRNVIFMPILLAMAGLNGLMHASVLLPKASWFMPSALSMLYMVLLIMVIMAGRIFPMFTANGTQTAKVESLPWLEKLVIASMLLIVLTQAGWFDLGSVFNSALLIAAALIHGVRTIRWRPWVTLKTPLVWSLHLSYWFVVAGFMLLAASELGFDVTRSQAVHSFTIAGMGLMILAMISRVSLGHTGWPLQVSSLMSAAFLLMVVAFATRFLAQAITGFYHMGLLLATLSWCVAFLLFIMHYSKILCQARPDGRPG